MSSNQTSNNLENQSATKTDNTVEWQNNISDAIKTLFNQTTISTLIWFLVVYFLLYVGVGIFYDKNETDMSSEMARSRTIDIILITVLLITTVSYYYTLSQKDRENLLSYFYELFKEELKHKNSAFFYFMLIMGLYLIIYLIRIPMTGELKPVTISIIESKLWIWLGMILFCNFFIYILNVPIVDLIFDPLESLWKKIPKVEEKKSEPAPAPKPVPTPAPNPVHTDKRKPKPEKEHEEECEEEEEEEECEEEEDNKGKEVFNISDNLYTYEDAQAVCSAFDAELATYDQIEESYNKGGEWCNYGWSEGQMAYFPTQKSTWNELQENPNTKNNCGRPGINGGFMANPYLRFGVNCFGKKPNKRDIDNVVSQEENEVPPSTPEDLALQEKVKYYKENADQILRINSFNNKKWSEY